MTCDKAVHPWKAEEGMSPLAHVLRSMVVSAVKPVNIPTVAVALSFVSLAPSFGIFMLTSVDFAFVPLMSGPWAVFEVVKFCRLYRCPT